MNRRSKNITITTIFYYYSIYLHIYIYGLFCFLFCFRLGNEAFIAKRYDVAMKHYTAAIEIDPENAVYYSNRSACYAGKQLWKESMVDSEVALLKDPSFMKAYYRLSVAQMELAMYEDAIQSLQRGLVKEPENALLIKQVRIVKAKQAQARTAAMGQRQLTDAQKKEIMDLQEQTKIYTKDLRGEQFVCYLCICCFVYVISFVCGVRCPIQDYWSAA